MTLAAHGLECSIRGRLVNRRGATGRRVTTMTDTGTHQIKITLRHSKPPIWRRLLVASDTRLDKLHLIIQEAMPWWDSHLHQFTAGETEYSNPAFELDFTEDERRVTLRDIAPTEGSRFDYIYDFGDGWEHIVEVEQILPTDPNQALPVCIKGKRTCPPEDVGGVWGYERFLEAIRDPNHSDHAMYSEWIGGEFDPEAFDLDALNDNLRKLG